MRNLILSILVSSLVWGFSMAGFHKINVDLPPGTSKTDAAFSLGALFLIPGIFLLIIGGILKHVGEKKLSKHMVGYANTSTAMIKFYFKVGNFLLSLGSLGLVSGIITIIGNL